MLINLFLLKKNLNISKLSVKIGLLMPFLIGVLWITVSDVISIQYFSFVQISH